MPRRLHSPGEKREPRDSGNPYERLLAQQTTLSRLSQMALITDEPGAMMDEAVRELASVLGVEYAKVLELLPDDKELLMRAGAGWKDGLVGTATVGAGMDSQAGYTLVSDSPVVVSDLRSETRFNGPPLLAEHGVVSGMSVIIAGRGKPYGVLGVHTRESREFTPDDVSFLQAVANILSSAIERNAAQSALRQSEEQHRIAMEASGAGAWEWNMQTNQVTWTESLERLHGLQPGTFPGTFAAYTRDIHPDDRERVLAAVAASVESGAHEIEYRIIWPDGSVHWLAARGLLLRNAEGEPERMTGICMDITEAKLAQQRQAAQHEIAQVLAASPEIPEAISRTLNIVCTTLDWEIGVLWSVDPTSGTLRCLDVVSRSPSDASAFIADTRERTFERGTGLPGETWEAGEPAWITDVCRDPNFLRRPTAEAAGICSAFAFPIVVATETIAVMEFLSRDMRQPDETLLQAMSTVGAQLGQFIARRRAQSEAARLLTAIDAQRQRMDNLLSNVPGIVWEAWGGPHEPEQRVNYVSQHVEAMLGYTVDEWLSTPSFWLRIVHPEDRERAASVAEEHYLRGQGGTNEFRWLTKDGRTVWVESKSSVINDDEGNPIGMRGVTMDISERKLEEARKAFLAEAGAILASSLDYEATLGNIARLLVNKVADACTVEVLDKGQIQRVAAAHVDGDQERVLLSSSASYPASPDTPDPVSRVVRTLQPELYPEIDPESLTSALQGSQQLTALQQMDVCSVIIVPLVAGGVAVGAITLICSDSKRTYTPADLTFAEDLAHRAGLAIDNARRYAAELDARQRAEKAEREQKFLAEASTILSSSLDYETTLQSVARLCVPQLGDWCVIDLVTGGTGLKRVAVVHSDPDKVAQAARLEEMYPPEFESDTGLGAVVRSGRSLLMAEVKDEMLRQIARDDEHLRLIQDLGLRSGMAVLMTALGRVIGVLSLGTAESGRVYTDRDLELAEDLARRAALAVENARLYTESQRIQEELRLANEAKDEFLGLVSHELRTPITTVFGGARLLRSRWDKLDEESRADVLADIEGESERLYRIVEDLLVLARLELGQQAVTEPVLAQRVIEKTIADFGRRRPGRSIKVQADDRLAPVRTSAVYLDQVLRNLITNADKYSPPDSGIEIEAHEDGGEVVVSVMDRGPGILPDEIERIFERFYRSSRTSAEAGGAGIGLTVCKRLLEAQDGRIWAEPRDGGGLRVSFALPVYSDDGS